MAKNARIVKNARVQGPNLNGDIHLRQGSIDEQTSMASVGDAMFIEETPVHPYGQTAAASAQLIEHGGLSASQDSM